MNCFLMEYPKSNTILMNFFRRTGILEEKGESDGDKKSLLFTENVAVFAYQPSKTTSSVFSKPSRK
ncbi:hypothetical protein JCM20313_09750 [Enterococcus faecalis]